MTLLVAYQLAYRKQKTLPSAWRPALPPFAVVRPRPVLALPGTGRPRRKA